MRKFLSEKHKQKISETLKGHKTPEETKKKISNTLTGRKLSEEHIRKMGESRKGKKRPPFSKEWKKKISKSKKGHKSGMTGKYHSQESRKKMSESHKGLHNSPATEFKSKGYKIKKQGYWWIHKPNHPNKRSGRVKQSHLVVEKILGRYLIKGECIHHINGIKDDDRPKNLYLFIKKEHDRYEGLLLKPRLKSNLTSSSF